MKEDTEFLILQGCKLARDLESNLPKLSSNGLHARTRTTCEEIVRAFTAAADKLKIEGGEYNKQRCFALEGGIDGREIVGLIDHNNCTEYEVRHLNSHGRRSRRRGRGEAEGKIVTVPAPQFGNANIPEDDGHTWRKYGQKMILGSKFPRAYYRCTHQRLYQCLAKKHVQRLDHDPLTFQVTYQGHHTCLMSSTAPLLPLGPQPPGDQYNNHPQRGFQASELPNHARSAPFWTSICPPAEADLPPSTRCDKDLSHASSM